ncbi:MAG: RNA polymerase factor sigma-54, partial [Planctomycetota bacterium]
ALEERIREEIEQNPTLELGTSVTETPSTDLEAAGEPAAGPVDAKEQGGAGEYEAAFEQLVEESNENFIPSHSPSRAAGIEAADKKHDAMQNMADRPPSLEDHLLEQLGFFEEEPIVIAFAKYLIANLDDHGFLGAPFEELRENFRNSDEVVAEFGRAITEEEADMGLDLVQQLEPTGVGARDLRECLLLQLRENASGLEHADVLRTIIANHFDDLRHNRLPVIERKTGFSKELLTAAKEELRHLELNPGSSFAPANTQYVVPDVSVERGSDGNFVIKINDDSTPNVYIRKDYQEMLKNGNGDPKALEYVKKKIMAARWLIDSIEQRRNTLSKVTQAIIDHQRDFLEKGPDFIEPLKMQQIADKVGVHVTTVSRAVDDKWVQTPRGIFPLKRFFGGGTVTATGEEVAWDIIKRKLTEVVNEDKPSRSLMTNSSKLGEQGASRHERSPSIAKCSISPPHAKRKQHL